VAEPGNEISELGFDSVLERLREVVRRLESGSGGLEESLRTYEQGVRLSRRGHALLDRAEKRVELLMQEGRDGANVVPFPESAESERHDEDEL
jgi:exodeoxyribonuclease VII small subunit